MTQVQLGERNKFEGSYLDLLYKVVNTVSSGIQHISKLLRLIFKCSHHKKQALKGKCVD